MSKLKDMSDDNIFYCYLRIKMSGVIGNTENVNNKVEM